MFGRLKHNVDSSDSDQGRQFRTTRYALELVEESDEVSHWTRRMHREYLDSSIYISDCFEIDFNVHGAISDCRVTCGITAFRDATCALVEPIWRPFGAVISDGVPIEDCCGIENLDLGPLYIDKELNVVWAGASSATQLKLPDNTVIYFDASAQIVGVSAPIESVS